MTRLAGKVMLLSGWPRALAAVLAGLFGVLALQPFGFFAALFVSFSVLVWLIDGASGDPDAGFLRRLAPAFKKLEPDMERIFWQSRYGRTP